MRYLVFILILNLIYMQELQVEGNLKVTGTIDAQGNPVTNIGEPVELNDAVNLGLMQNSLDELSNLKLERIYSYKHNEDDQFSFTVPSNKIWKITGVANAPYFIDGIEVYPFTMMDESWAFSNEIISGGWGFQPFIMTIFEYSISGSGSDQGLDYIEP
jgi:hypothetical protein